MFRGLQEQTCSFIVDIFNVNRVRYTGLKELSEDVWMILRTRIEMVQTRLSTELLPVALLLLKSKIRLNFRFYLLLRIGQLVIGR
uniref:Uncharacterized protein n=1 Tax=Ascaris lumbricoides TaxID=6252 RepID=A0A0M3HKV2_ASCLU